MTKYLFSICKRNPSYLMNMQSSETRIFVLQSNHVKWVDVLFWKSFCSNIPFQSKKNLSKFILNNDGGFVNLNQVNYGLD